MEYRPYRSVYNKPEWIGQKFNKLEVIEPVHVTLNNGTNQWFWRVKCDCGEERMEKPIAVINGKVKTCGCGKLSYIPRNKTHNESHTRLHNIWCGMNNRCDPTHAHTERYGKRGISICEEWKQYENFASWARHNGYKDNLTIERKDVNGDYCPENCTWIELKKQARNRCTTHWVNFQGREMSLAEACEIANMPYKQVFERITKLNWSVETALMTPMHFKSLGIAVQKQNT